MSGLSTLRRLVAGLLRRRRSGPPPGFGEQLAEAIARDSGVLLRVDALERSLAAPARNPQRNDSRNH